MRNNKTHSIDKYGYASCGREVSPKYLIPATLIRPTCRLCLKKDKEKTQIIDVAKLMGWNR